MITKPFHLVDVSDTRIMPTTLAMHRTEHSIPHRAVPIFNWEICSLDYASSLSGTSRCERLTTMCP